VGTFFYSKLDADDACFAKASQVKRKGLAFNCLGFWKRSRYIGGQGLESKFFL